MTTQHEEMLKRFEEKFEMFDGTLATRDGHNWRNANSDDLKSFLKSEIDLAVAEREKEIVDALNKADCPVKKDHPKECHYAIALSDILSLLTPKSELK